LIPFLLADTAFLPGEPRAITRSQSASRDVSVFEYAYGPRAQGQVGADFGIVSVKNKEVAAHVGFHGMIALENGVATKPFPPHELWRGVLGTSLSVSYPRLKWLPGVLELSLLLGHESDHEDKQYRGELRPIDRIPYGGGGNYLTPDVAVRLRAGPLAIIVRLQDRIYTNAFPALLGARVASDQVASSLREGLYHAPGFDLIVRYGIWSAALFGERLIARDVPDGGFLRFLAGPALPGRVGELQPFVSFDAGNGKGMLIHRREARFSIGVRYALF
jgi:hypothetical protein